MDLLQITSILILITNFLIKNTNFNQNHDKFTIKMESHLVYIRSLLYSYLIFFNIYISNY